MGGAGELTGFVNRVSRLLRGPATTCAPAATVADVASRMPPGGAGVVVVDAAGAPVGIVTDRDLRSKVVAMRRDAGTTLATEVMSAPVVTIAPDALAFEALLEMTRREIHHLVVVDAGRLVGLLASDDVLMSQAVHPVTLAREIGRAPSRAALARLAADVTTLVQRLVDEGGRAGDVARIVAELNDRIVARLLAQVEAALRERGESPPMPYCWLVFGSEARREQTLRTDQDNGLVYADPSPDLAEAAARYFARLAEEAIAGLVEVGFPPCPGGAMASNPRWCQPLATWTGYFREWMARPTPEHVLAASMYFDLRPVVGELRARGVAGGAGQEPRRPGSGDSSRSMAGDVVDRRLPVGLLGGLRTPRSGPHRGALDLKGAGGIQLVGAGRVHALELGLAETETAAGSGPPARAASTRWLRLPRSSTPTRISCACGWSTSSGCLRAGRPPDNHVPLRGLSHRDGVLLREGLRTVARVQGGLRERFATDYAV